MKSITIGPLYQSSGYIDHIDNLKAYFDIIHRQVPNKERYQTFEIYPKENPPISILTHMDEIISTFDSTFDKGTSLLLIYMYGSHEDFVNIFVKHVISGIFSRNRYHLTKSFRYVQYYQGIQNLILDEIYKKDQDNYNILISDILTKTDQIKNYISGEISDVRNKKYLMGGYHEIKNNYFTRIESGEDISEEIYSNLVISDYSFENSGSLILLYLITLLKADVNKEYTEYIYSKIYRSIIDIFDPDPSNLVKDIFTYMIKNKIYIPFDIDELYYSAYGVEDKI